MRAAETATSGVGHAALFERACRVTPGGVHSPARAFRAVSARPIAIVGARGARVRDAEGREYVDWLGAWGAALLGHAHPGIVEAVARAARRGLNFGLASPPEVELAERVQARVPGADMLRFVATGTEAAMSAIRVARAATGRETIIKFEGCYHGHADPFLIRAGSGAATLGVPDSPGVTAGAARDTLVARFNDLDSVDRRFGGAADRVAALIVEPVAGNMGCVPPEPGFLAALRERCDRHGALLVFDETITGLRVARGGAAERWGVTPDLVVLGKALGGGMPLAAFGGRRDLMSRVAPAGPVYQAGTHAAHPLAVAAGLAVQDALDRDPGLHDRLEAVSARLEEGLREAARAAGVGLHVQRVGSMWTPFFAPAGAQLAAGAGARLAVRSWDEAGKVDRERFAAFFRGLLGRGVLLPPSAFETSFVSAAHGEEDLALTLEAARATLAELA